MPTTLETIAAILFGIAIVHTFSTSFFERLATTQPNHARLWHLLGEVEVAFGFWALVLVVAILATEGEASMKQYMSSRNFTEPMFVFVIMVIASTRPILQTVTTATEKIARATPLPGSISFYFFVLTLLPLLGSFITEPAAMTLAALIVSERLFTQHISSRLKYATLGVLFVNVSIGGTLTSFAAPPVLMVAGAWGWDMHFMLSTFGWKAAIAVFVNALMATFFFRKELAALNSVATKSDATPVPLALVLIHFSFLASVVFFAHYSAIFMGIFLFFLGVVSAYRQYQDELILRQGLLVAFFLAGLVVLGGQQQWWLQPVLMEMSSDQVFFGALSLTAFTDNAALTYLGSLVEGLSDGFKYALVAGAVAGGGLTVIANAPNPAGVAILREHFENASVHPIGLLLAALPPTLIAALAFLYL